MNPVSAPIDFESIVTNSVDLVTVMRRDGGIIYESPSIISILGYAQDELIGKNALTLVHPSDIGRVAKTLGDGLLHPNITYSLDVRYKHKNGGWVTLECRAQYLPESSFAGILVHSRDVTNRVEKDQQLRDSLEDLRKLSRAVEQSPNSIVITDKNGLIEYVNPAFVATTGYTSDEAMGKNPRILQSGKTPLSVYKDMWETLLSGQTWRGEILNKKKDGSLFWESATFSPVFDDAGVITNFLAIKKDITKEKEIANKLAVSEQQFQGVIQAVSSGIVIHDQEGNIVTANPAAQTILGLTLDQMTGKSIRDSMWKAVHEDGSDFPDVEFPVMQTLKSGEAQHDVVMGVHKPDGQISWIMISTVVSGIDEVSHAPKGVIASFTDITALRNASEVLKQKTVDLERMNKLMVGRELKMIELKDQLRALKGGG